MFTYTFHFQAVTPELKATVLDFFKSSNWAELTSSSFYHDPGTELTVSFTSDTNGNAYSKKIEDIQNFADGNNFSVVEKELINE